MPVVTLTLPQPPRAPTRPPFPVIAVIAPLVAALVIGAIIRSPYVLVFAALSPVMAIASLVEGRRAARRERRTESERFDRECAEFDERLAGAHRAEAVAAVEAARSREAIVIATRPAPSAVLAAQPALLTSPEPAVADALARCAARAATNPRMPVLLPDGPIVVRGSGPVAQRLDGVVSLAPAPRSRDGDPTVLEAHGLTEMTIIRPGSAPERVDPVVPFLATLRREAERARASALPDEVAWADIAGSTGAALTVGVAEDGPIGLDLVADGPHIIVGGATGSGKSEFLRALALSAARDPDTWSVLFVDFKGGATFDDFRSLPATVGLITDLDAALADRALGSLRAEIRRRERLLRDHQVRDIAEAPLDSEARRLMIVVDEYAAMVEAHPGLQAAFADISARGRSLGLHLVLCTQRPAGVVHDAVAVNCAIRVVFRTPDPTDARALIGTTVSGLDVAPRGRAHILRDGAVRVAHIARVTGTDIARTAAAQPERGKASAPPWAEPLPSSIPRDDPRVIAAAHGSDLAEGSLLFGVVDEVDEQRWVPAVWTPQRDGPLAVLGVAQSGRTGALAAIASSARRHGWRVIVLPRTLADAVPVLAEAGETAATVGGRTLLVADGFGELATASAPEHVQYLLEAWDAAARRIAAAGGAVAADLGAPSSALRILTGRFGARLILRSHDEDEHRQAGAPRGAYDHHAPAGRGWWRGRAVQVVLDPDALPPAARVDVPRVTEGHAALAIVTIRPDHVRESIAVAGALVAVSDLAAPGATPSSGDARAALIGHPDEWQRDHAALAHARRTARIVLDGLTASDVRALLGPRAVAPPREHEEVWFVEPGQGSQPRIDRGRW